MLRSLVGSEMCIRDSYRVLINAANSGCGQAVSNNGIAVITEDLLVTTQPSNVNECIGGADQMTVVVSGGSGAVTYQWQSSADGINAVSYTHLTLPTIYSV